MRTTEIIFSPTGGTAKIARILSSQLDEHPSTIDLCNPNGDFSDVSFTKEDMAVIAMPSFGGRAPAIAMERLGKISGNGARCTLVAVYGNRAYEDTLVEMEDAAKKCGFQVVAAIAAVAQHSIISKYASGRPDSSDEKQLAEFAKQIAEKTDCAVSIPGNRPYKKPGGAGLVPTPSRDCAKCGVCAKSCPVSAIDHDNFSANAKACISCMRCVKYCPHDARKVNGAMVSIAAMAIKKACAARKGNELFL